MDEDAHLPSVAPPIGDGRFGAVLVVLTGLPGTGKTTIARALATALPAAYCSVDAVFTVLEAEGLTTDDPLGKRSYALVQRLAALQLELGVSAVVDAVNPFEWGRAHLRLLADRHATTMRLIATTCTDPHVHRTRIDGRPAGAGWDEVERQVGYYEPPADADLRLDAVDAAERNIARALALVRRT